MFHLKAGVCPHGVGVDIPPPHHFCLSQEEHSAQRRLCDNPAVYLLKGYSGLKFPNLSTRIAVYLLKGYSGLKFPNLSTRISDDCVDRWTQISDGCGGSGGSRW
jgi:hypothetical protein